MSQAIYSGLTHVQAFNVMQATVQFGWLRAKLNGGVNTCVRWSKV